MEQEMKMLGGIISIKKSANFYEIKYDTGELGRIYILNGHSFRYYVSHNEEFKDFPEPKNKADVAKIVTKSVSEYDTVPFEISVVEENKDAFIIDAEHIQICFVKDHGQLSITDKRNDKEVLREALPLSLSKEETSQVLVQHRNEHFYGGGMQNGRFAHKGKIINIQNTNVWTDGGVTSPNPFYWSTRGYGVLRNTWQPGVYDFGEKTPERISTAHNVDYFDAFYFVNSQPEDLLSDYFHITGRPLLVPEYAFYEAHLNTFNRDYWVKVAAETPGAVLFEDGEYYKSYKPGEMDSKKGILESLNGELDNYQFSARAMIDRYKLHDMPLGWFLPNDGYGSGYGQTDSLRGDIENLREFGDYSRANGIEVALWTESNLRPKDPDNPKKGERDLFGEVSQAGVVALKCDVAWIGEGYSFGLNAVETATNIFDKATKQARPFIIMVDGWAGTQRYAGIWSGDQSGGRWEYIRFHIPTYIGAGLSGQPIVGSDMDGIYAGGVKEINVRDYQWKTFTPLQLNMDGWGKVPKTPFTYDDEAKGINRAYLKLKSMLMPYNYTISYESIRGLPMVRAMFLGFPREEAAYTNDSKYQFMWGPNILVAPVYKPGPVRNEIYLPGPHQVWIDFFTGEMYQGGKIYNNFEVPLWKVPVFVKNGSILPMTHPNNNPYEIQRDSRIFNLYPDGESSFDVFEDDGMSMAYANGYHAKTKVKMVFRNDSTDVGDLHIAIGKTVGKYRGMVKQRDTLIQIMTSVENVNVEVMSQGDFIPLKHAATREEFESLADVYFITRDFISNLYLKDFAEDKLKQKFLLIKLRKVDITEHKFLLKVIGFANKRTVFGREPAVLRSSSIGIAAIIPAPTNFTVTNTTPTTVSVSWDAAENPTFYEIERDGVVFTHITGNKWTFDGFNWSSDHSFRIRVFSRTETSEWSELITARTEDDPFKNTVKGVKVTCNLPCQPGHEVHKLTDCDTRSMWHTDWGSAGRANPQSGHVLKLKFDLGASLEIDNVEYVPRLDAGNGTLLEIQYRYSGDGDSWSSLSEVIHWSIDASSKIIELHGTQFRYFELIALDSYGDFGSGRQIYFHKKS